jgi:hydroxymethylpyrimidine pyrophosphatase-like HAD family hydrolase
MAPGLLPWVSAVIFKALACDYDGTLASQDRIGTEALSALGSAREAGLRLILVTGRTFFELTRVCEPLDLFDAVVAENGAVLYFPREALIHDQGPPPPPRLLRELDRRGISYQVGRVIVGVARGDEDAVRAALEVAGVAREPAYNRAALMLLPSGVSKGTGVRHALRVLGLSFHDVLGIGDAENDMELFQACGWRACPGNAVDAIKAEADWVFPGQDGQAVAAAIAAPALEGLPVARSPRHRIPLGWVAATSEPVTIPARGVNVLIQGDPLSGKSWLAGALFERLAAGRYAVCVIDPEGDYRVLAGVGGVTWVEIRDQAGMERALGRFERDPSASVVADLSLLAHARKVEVIEAALRRIHGLRRRRGLPHWVVLDEAHYSLHPDGVPESSLAIEDKGFCLASYRSSWLRASVAKALDVFVLARTTAPHELDFLRSRLSRDDCSEEVVAVLPDLPGGEFLVVQPDHDGGWARATVVATPRETPHVRHRRKYADARVAAEERFFFRHPDGSLAATADSLLEFRRAIASVEDAALAYHAGRGDFSRWVLDVFSDEELGRQLRKVETRWRRGELSDLRGAIDRLITFRYGPAA